VKSEILKLKLYIKELAAIQKQEKGILRQDHRKLDKPWKLQGDTCSRAAKITAALNLYNELRGKKYRHEYKDPSRNWILIYAKKQVGKDLEAREEKEVAA